MNVSAGPDGGLFSVELDGQRMELDSYMPNIVSCQVGLVALDHLENESHTIFIVTLGPSPQASVTSSGGLHIEGIVSVFSNHPERLQSG